MNFEDTLLEIISKESPTTFISLSGRFVNLDSLRITDPFAGRKTIRQYLDGTLEREEPARYREIREKQSQIADFHLYQLPLTSANVRPLVSDPYLVQYPYLVPDVSYYDHCRFIEEEEWHVMTRVLQPLGYLGTIDLDDYNFCITDYLETIGVGRSASEESLDDLSEELHPHFGFSSHSEEDQAPPAPEINHTHARSRHIPKDELNRRRILAALSKSPLGGESDTGEPLVIQGLNSVFRHKYSVEGEIIDLNNKINEITESSKAFLEKTHYIKDFKECDTTPGLFLLNLPDDVKTELIAALTVGLSLKETRQLNRRIHSEKTALLAKRSRLARRRNNKYAAYTAETLQLHAMVKSIRATGLNPRELCVLGPYPNWYTANLIIRKHSRTRDLEPPPKQKFK
jgi:hypothetical protein